MNWACQLQPKSLKWWCVYRTYRRCLWIMAAQLATASSSSLGHWHQRCFDKGIWELLAARVYKMRLPAALLLEPRTLIIVENVPETMITKRRKTACRTWSFLVDVVLKQSTSNSRVGAFHLNGISFEPSVCAPTRSQNRVCTTRTCEWSHNWGKWSHRRCEMNIYTCLSLHRVVNACQMSTTAEPLIQQVGPMRQLVSAIGTSQEHPHCIPTARWMLQ